MVGKKLAVLGTAVLILALTAGGCAQKTPPAESGAPAVEEPAGKKHINAALYWFGTSLDPATEWDGWTTSRAGITETLVTVDKDYQIQPLLADSWEQIDEKTWKLHIREGVTFHNGKPLDGAAVKASFERAMQTQERAKTAANIEAIEAEGQHVTFRTAEPFGAFLATISEPLYSVIDVSSDSDFASSPVATGPYMVKGFTVNTSIELEAYKDYWNGVPGAETVTVKNIEDDSTRGLALQSGEMDLVQRVAWTDIPMFEKNSDFQVFDTLGARTRILVFNHSNEFLADKNVRQAIASAIDYDSLISILGKGVGKAGAPYPSSAPYGYDELKKQSFDKEAAKQALEASGYQDADGNGYVEKGGKELQFKITYANSDYTGMLEAIQSMVKESGIRIDLNLVDSTSEFTENKNFDIICTNWQVLSTGDPQWFLDSMFRSGASTNYGNYSNPKLDEIADKLAGAFDLEKRRELTIEAEKVLLEDVASVYICGENNFVLANNKVKNITPYPIDYYFIDHKLTIE